MCRLKYLLRPIVVVLLLTFMLLFWFGMPILAQTVIATIGVGSSPRDVAVNPATNRIYVTNANGNFVSVIDGKTNTVVADTPVTGETLGLQVNSPLGVAVNPTTNRVYVAVRNSDAVSVIDGNTNTVIAMVPVERGPINVSVNPTTNLIYATNALTDTMAVIDGNTNTSVTTVSVGFGALHAAANPMTNRIYVANNNTSAILVIDGNTNTIDTTIPVDGPLRVAVNTTTNRIYVVNDTGDRISVIDGDTNTVISTIQVDSGPTGVAVNPTTNRVYAANSDGRSVSVIDGDSNAIVATVPVDGPLHLAVNPTTNRIYVTNDINDTVSVIEDLPRALPRAGGPSVEVIVLIGLALIVFGFSVWRRGAARHYLVIGLFLILLALGTSLTLASEQSLGGSAPPVTDKRIALTFDDGYNSRNVNRVLDTLERDGVRATFFPVGIWVQRDPVTFRRIEARHEVGDHTFSHPFLTRLSDAAVRREILGGVVVPPFLFRPPYGDINARVRAIVLSLGFRVVLWDVDSRDYTGISPAQVTRNVVRNAGGGKIVLMHMGDWNTARALPEIIRQLRAAGFTFVTVSELGSGGEGR